MPYTVYRAEEKEIYDIPISEFLLHVLCGEEAL